MKKGMKSNDCKPLWIVLTCLLFGLSSCSTAPTAAAPVEVNVKLQEPAAPTEAPAPLPSPTASTVPTSTPAPSPTSTASPTARPTSTPAPTLDLKATRQAKSTQTAGNIMDDLKEIAKAANLSLDQGYLLWAQEEPEYIFMGSYNEWLYFAFAEGLVGSDFVLKTEITWESTTGLATCGLFFRSEKNIELGKQYYFEMLRLSGLPAWEIVYIKGDEYHKYIAEPQTHRAINQDNGGTNEIVIIAEQDHFTLFINDVRMGTFYDFGKSMLEGYFAFSGWQESGHSRCTFSNTVIWSLVEPEPSDAEPAAPPASVEDATWMGTPFEQSSAGL